MPKDSFKFFSNRQCRYYPCHADADPDNFNCLFCYCPLDTIKNCGGNYNITEDGIKDCSQCLYPHLSENYKDVVKKVKQRLEEYPFPENGYEIHPQTISQKEQHMDAMQAIRERHSVRSYKKTRVAKEKVQELVAAANSAPYAGPFNITAVMDAAILEGLEDTTLAAMRESPLQFLRDLAETPGYRPLYEAPAMLVFSAPKENPFGLANCANAATTGAIAGTAMGLGTCYVVTPTLALNRDAELCKKLGIPANNQVHCCLLFGHTEDPNAGRKERDLGDNCNYYG